MKKLYTKGTIFPTPTLVLDQLSFLPATILTLTAALSQEDRQVLAYLIACSSSSNISSNLGNTHKNINCYCFNCYMSYWVKWDSSPNRHIIHEIIDAFEEYVLQKKKGKSKKQRRNNKNRGSYGGSAEMKSSEMCESETCGNHDGGVGEKGDGEGVEKGSVTRRFVSFLGESLWNIWN